MLNAQLNIVVSTVDRSAKGNRHVVERRLPQFSNTNSRPEQRPKQWNRHVLLLTLFQFVSLVLVHTSFSSVFILLHMPTLDPTCKTQEAESSGSCPTQPGVTQVIGPFSD